MLNRGYGVRCDSGAPAPFPDALSGFDYRSIVGLDASDRSIPWQSLPPVTVTALGPFTAKLPNLNPGGVY